MRTCDICDNGYVLAVAKLPMIYRSKGVVYPVFIEDTFTCSTCDHPDCEDFPRWSATLAEQWIKVDKGQKAEVIQEALAAKWRLENKEFKC